MSKHTLPRWELRMRPRRLRRLLALTAIGAATVAGAIASTPHANALPGQCTYSPWGGFCDGPANSSGVWQHCETVLGFTNCFLVRAVPTDVDPRGWAPA